MKNTTLYLLVLLAFLTSAMGQTKTHTILDPFNANHGWQVVRYTETFPDPGVALDTLNVTVNGQTVPFQRRAISTHPDGTVKEGEWALYLNLRPDPKGDNKKKDEGESAPKPASSPSAAASFKIELLRGKAKASIPPFAEEPISITEDGPHFLIQTGAARFKIPNKTITKSKAGPHGPIVAFSNGSDPKWYGMNNHIATEGNELQEVETKWIEKGPFAATADVNFTFADDTTWRSRLTFVKNADVVQIEDSMDANGEWWIDLTEDMAPDTQFACPWFDWTSGSQRGGWNEKTLRPYTRAEIRGGEWHNLNEFFRLDPKWHDYQYMKGPAAWYYNKAKRAENATAFAMFAWNMTRWHPTYNNRPRAFVSDQPGTLRIRVPIPGGAHTRTLESENPTDPVPRVVRTSTAERSWAIGAFEAPNTQSWEAYIPQAKTELKPEWEKQMLDQIRKERNEAETKAKAELEAENKNKKDTTITKEMIAERMIKLGFPADKAEKDLVAERLKKNPDPTQEAIEERAKKILSGTLNQARTKSLRTLVTFAHLPVQKFKDWIIDWPDIDKNLDKGIFRGKEDYIQLQKELVAGQSLLAKMYNDYVEEMKATLTQTTDKKGNTVTKADRRFRDDWAVAERIPKVDPSKEPLFTYTARGGMRANPSFIYNSSYTEGMLNPTTAPRGARITIWMNSINNYLKTSGMSGINRENAIMAYIFRDPDFWNGRYYDWGIGNPNFHTDMYNIPGMIAAQINSHPHAKQWADFAVREIYADIGRSSWKPGGAWTESPGYTGHTFSVILPTAHAFRRAGFTNIFKDKDFQETLSYIMNLSTPFDRRIGTRGTISIGDSTSRADSGNLALAAKGFQDTNAKLAGDLMAAYFSQSVGKGMRAKIPDSELVDTLAALDLNVPPSDNWQLQTGYFAGFGGLLRSRFGKEDETLVTMKAGPARNHYQGDELSYTFWGEGTYLAVDYSSFYSPRMSANFMQNSLTFGLTGGGGNGRVMAFQTSEAGDLIVADQTVESLSFHAHPYPANKSPWDVPNANTAIKEVRRLLLLVKHPESSKIADYLIVRDELSGNVRGGLQTSLAKTAIESVAKDTLEAYMKDANWVPSLAEELYKELNYRLVRHGLSQAAADDLTAKARAAHKPGVYSGINLETDAPDILPALKAWVHDKDGYAFDPEPIHNIHLYVHDQPKITSDRIDFKGQMGVDLSLFIATGQDAQKANLEWYGWGHNIHPQGYPKEERGNYFPWFRGAWHSYRHGFVIGRDVRLPDDTSSTLPVYKFGETCQWLQLPFQGKDELTLVLYPHKPGKPSPNFETIDGGKAVKVNVDGEEETIHVATNGAIKLIRGGKETVIAASIPKFGDPIPDALVPRKAIEAQDEEESSQTTESTAGE